MVKDQVKISVLGDGGWGTTLSLLLADKGYAVNLWGAFPDYVQLMRKKRENVKFLPGFKIPERVNLSSNLSQACHGADLIVLAVPSQFMRAVLSKLKKKDIKGKRFLNVAKGIEKKTHQVMSQVIHECLGPVRLAILSGPCIAREIAMKMPAAVTVASQDEVLVTQIRKYFSTSYFHVYESDDGLGVQLGGSLKNVIAISAGMVDGLGYGSNTSAAVFARGLAEISRLGEVMGAQRKTFMGLSGLGDLATTCLSPHSRNRSLGEAVGKGQKLKDLLKQSDMVVEGVETSISAYELAKQYKVPMPICSAVYKILFKSANPKSVVDALMTQKLHNESI